MDEKAILQSTQEQAVAAWINYLNQTRIDQLIERLNEQSNNLDEALRAIDMALQTIGEKIIERNRGGATGMHGFIAEIAEVGIENAQQLIKGDLENSIWVDNNGPVDIIRGTTFIQTKFVNAGGKFSLGAIAEHLQTYPDFIKNGGIYQIPSDHYMTVRKLSMLSEEEASVLLSRSGEGPSFSQWLQVQSFFKETGLKISDLEPSQLGYKDAQRDAISSVLSSEKEALRKQDYELRELAYKDSLPSLQEGASATAVAAVLEGGTALCLAMARKRRERKAFSNFTPADWEEIAHETGKGTAKGGIRGASVYILSNYTLTSAAVASAIVTASFGIADQAHLFRNGNIEEAAFIEYAELLCLDASVSALSSFVGQALIPVPVLGAIVGNTVGTMMYQIAKDNLSAKEQKLIKQYVEEQRSLNSQLEERYASCIDSLNEATTLYYCLLLDAFAIDPFQAFEGSIKLAYSLGVPSEKILDTPEKAVAYFTE